jgi:hypothetical protein
MMIGPNNELTSPDNLSRRAKRLLRDYRLVQYDLSMGERYSLEDMFYTVEGRASLRAFDRASPSPQD